MVLLIHHPVSPAGRKIRLQMSEKKMLFILREEEPWKVSDDVYKLNPAGELPVFLSDGNVIAGNYAISEYLEEASPDVPMIFGDTKHRAEIRRLVDGFDNSRILKIGLNNLLYHLEYIEWLLERRQYLASDTVSLADLSAAAELSIIDYLGSVPWDEFKTAKLWYSKMKSRPSFKDILKDNIRGILPAKHYTNLDF